MNNKELLIKILLESEYPVTSSNLAARCQLSRRTIFKYIAEINSEYLNLINSSPKGYSVTNTDALRQLLVQKTNIQTPQQRVEYLLKLIVINHIRKDDNDLDIYELSDKLGISESTLYKDIQNIRQYLESYHIELKVNKDKIIIEGKEREIQLITNELYFSEIRHVPINIENVSQAFTNYNVGELVDIINKITTGYGYYINHLSMPNIIIYIIIGIDRLQSNNRKYQPKSSGSSQKNSVLLMI